MLHFKCFKLDFEKFNELEHKFQKSTHKAPWREKEIQNIKQVMRLGGSNEKLQHMSNMSSKRQNKVRCNNLKK